MVYMLRSVYSYSTSHDLIANLMCGVMVLPYGRHCLMEQSLIRCVCCMYACVCYVCVVCVGVSVCEFNLFSLQNMQGQEILKMIEGGQRMKP